MNTVKPGDFGLSRIGGLLGWLINVGQAATGDASRYTHAFVVLDDWTVLEAMPSGARIAPLNKYYNKAVFSDIELTDEERAAIVRNARELEGTKYGFSGYVYLLLSALGIRPKWLINYVMNNGRMICSQLVDYVYCKAGVHLFNDGRKPNDVTPGDLANMLLERRWIK